MNEQGDNQEGVTLVTGSKSELDENLTSEELEALEAFYAAIERQGDVSSLDPDTLGILEKIWVVRKTRGITDPIIKVIWGAPIIKRSDFIE